jgi:hypothetical protein
MKDEVKLQLRLPAEIRDWLKHYAEQHNRSTLSRMRSVLLWPTIVASHGSSPKRLLPRSAIRTPKQ